MKYMLVCEFLNADNLHLKETQGEQTMTNEQAIEQLQKIEYKEQDVVLECAIQKAILALEKQIPRRVLVYDKQEYIGITYDYYCPNCHRPINKDMINVCKTCGQALKWSENI